MLMPQEIPQRTKQGGECHCVSPGAQVETKVGLLFLCARLGGDWRPVRIGEAVW